MAAPTKLLKLQALTSKVSHLVPQLEGSMWYATKAGAGKTTKAKSATKAVNAAKPAAVKEAEPAKPSAVKEAEPAKPSAVKEAEPPKPSAVGKVEQDWDISTYKVPEYYNYNPMSFYDIDVQMGKQRLNQPNPK